MDRESLLNPTVALPSERPRLAAISGRARAMLTAVIDGLDTRERGWLESTPLDRAVVAASGFRPFTDYDVPRPPAFHRIEQEVAAAGGDPWKLTYSRLLLLALLARLPAQTLPLRVPALVWEAVEDALEPFVEEIPGLGAAGWSDTDFLKDLAVAQLRMLPSAGVALTVLRLNPWYLTSQARLRERVAVGAALGLAGCRPGLYLTGHGWRGFRGGWERPPERRNAPLAALAAANPQIVAWLSGSWLNDPALETISRSVHPDIQLYLANGGRRFRMSSNPEVVRMGTSTSQTRRRLYEEGKYLPTTYGIILTRKDLLRWARTPAFLERELPERERDGVHRE